MRTNTRIDFGLYDVTARGDSTPVCTTAQAWNQVAEDLKRETAPQLPKYGTLERRQHLMDGSYTLFPDEPENAFFGLWSSQQSGSDGAFSNPPVLDISFSEPHSSVGLTLHAFAPDQEWPTDLTVEWFGRSGELLSRGFFHPDSVDFYCDNKVENFFSLRLIFNAVNKPFRYLKLRGIDYGSALTFAGEEVVEAHILEEVDLLSNEISINTLNLTLYNREGKFSILNPAGVFDVLQHKQKFTVWEDVKSGARSADTISHNMGTFYLSDWENTSDTLASFTATDAVGLLDSAPHNGGIYQCTVREMAADILAGYDYELAPELADESISGYLPIGTRRSALQQMAFAIGAVVDCSRSNLIRIYPPAERPSSLIRSARKMMGSKVALKPLITGVSVTAHRYQKSATVEELYSDDLTAGVHQITFSEPAADISAAGAQLVEVGSNYAIINAPKAGSVVLTGRIYSDTQTVLRQSAENIPPNAQDNELQITDATLVSPGRAAACAKRVLDYYAHRYEQTFAMVAGDELLADMLIVESFGGEKVKGSLEKMEFDLTGGYLADVRVVGQRIDTTAAAYAGEIYTGERSVI